MLKHVRPVIITLVMLSFLITGLGSTAAQDDPDDMMEITLHFAATVGDEMAMCGATYEAIGTAENSLNITDFRFYVSNIHLLTEDGEAVPLQLVQDGVWQYQNVALLDFEDGTADCSASGNGALNGSVHGMLPVGNYTGLQFDLGVPFELNHLNNATAPAPLNIPSLWWSWAGGFKFVRIDTQPNTDYAWLIHIGSTACASPDMATAPTERCGHPNITTITFDEFGENDVVVADLALFFSELDLNENTPAPAGCQSNFDDPDCVPIFAALGLDMETGACPEGGCVEQHLFRVSDVGDVTLIETIMLSDDMNMNDNSTSHSNSGH